MTPRSKVYLSDEAIARFVKDVPAETSDVDAQKWLDIAMAEPTEREQRELATLAELRRLQGKVREWAPRVKELSGKADLGAKIDALTKAVPAVASAKWLTTAQVAECTGVSKSSIERLKARAEANGVEGPWAYVGRRLQWRADRIDDFLAGAKQWHGSKNGQANIKSAGGTSPVKSNGAPARRSALPKNSNEKSRIRSASGTTGSLRSLAVSLSSKK